MRNNNVKDDTNMVYLFEQDGSSEELISLSDKEKQQIDVLTRSEKYADDCTEEVNRFKKKFDELKKKAEMDRVDVPVVFDADEEGYVLIDEKGVFHFADSRYNWVESYLNIRELENMRFSKTVDKDVEEGLYSNIRLHFSSGDVVRLYYEECRYGVEIRVTFKADEKYKDMIENIKERCTREYWLVFEAK